MSQTPTPERRASGGTPFPLDGGVEMPVLTLWQPWASLVALEAKTIETRSWSTKYRGPLAISAAARPLRERVVLGDYEAWPPDTADRPHANFPDGRPARLYRNTGHWPTHAQWHPLPFGAIVATCTLLDVLPIVDERDCGWDLWGTPCAHAATDGQVIWHREGYFHTTVVVEEAFGDYTPGRFAWLFSDIERLDEPVPFRGGQGLTRKVELHV